MKLAILGFMIAVVSAQEASNATSTDVTPSTTVPVGTSACAVQSTFELCLENEDKYIKTCQDQDFACLCRWNKEKLTCWNNCPNDQGLAAQEGVVQIHCSMPGANASVPLWTSSMVPSSTPAAASSAVSSSASAVPTTATSEPSSASALTMSARTLAIVGVAAAYILF